MFIYFQLVFVLQRFYYLHLHLLRNLSLIQVNPNVVLILLKLDFLLPHFLKNRTDNIHRIPKHSTTNQCNNDYKNLLITGWGSNISVANCNHCNEGEINTVQVSNFYCTVNKFFLVYPSVDFTILNVVLSDKMKPAPYVVGHCEYEN